MAETVMEAVAMRSFVHWNVGVTGKVLGDQVEVSPKSIEATLPPRRKKTVDRLLASSGEEKQPKEFSIEKGRGEIFHVKHNILKFSGFVWSEEEKLKGKFQDKLNKYNKEMLLNLCDLLDIYICKRRIKKEQLVAKLIEFLESPQATRDLSVDDTIQRLTAKELKRKSNGSLIKIPNQGFPHKRQKNSVVSGEDEVPQTVKENVEEDAAGEKDSVKVKERKEIDGDYSMKKTVGKRIPRNKKENEEVHKTLVFNGNIQRRKHINVASLVKSNSKQKHVANEDTRNITKKSVDLLSGTDLCLAISEIVGEVTDFERTTYRDIVEQLERRFGIDLSERKLQLRRMIQVELSRLAEIDENYNEFAEKYW